MLLDWMMKDGHKNLKETAQNREDWIRQTFEAAQRQRTRREISETSHQPAKFYSLTEVDESFSVRRFVCVVLRASFRVRRLTVTNYVLLME